MSLQTPDISPLLRDVDPQQLAASIDPNVVQDILRSPPVFDDQAFLRQRFGDASTNRLAQQQRNTPPLAYDPLTNRLARSFGFGSPAVQPPTVSRLHLCGANNASELDLHLRDRDKHHPTSNAAPLELQGLPDGSFHLPALQWGLVSVRRQQ